jgi:hypothetical protein
MISSSIIHIIYIHSVIIITIDNIIIIIDNIIIIDIRASFINLII